MNREIDVIRSKDVGDERGIIGTLWLFLARLESD